MQSIPNYSFEDDLFDSRRQQDKNEYSTFIEQLQQSTQKLMNEVFNSEYVPQINEEQIDQSAARSKKKYSNMTSLTASRKKSQPNHFNSTKRTAATRCQEEQLSESFVNFLKRNQKWKERRLERAKNQTNKKQQQELKGLTFMPSILRASRQKVQPIYERCLQLQKEKQKKLALKRMEKEKQQSQKNKQCTFQPQINTKGRNRTLQEYLRDKEEWKNRKQEFIENSKIIREAQKYEECIFQPVLVAKYSRMNNKIKQGQKVEDRLLRSLQKSMEEKQKQHWDKKKPIKSSKNIKPTINKVITGKPRLK